MLHTTTIALIAGGAILLLIGLAALVGRRPRRRRAQYADLPALLYFTGSEGSSDEGAAARRPAGALPGWPAVRPVRDARAARAVAWGPAPDERVRLLPGSLRPEGGDEEIRFVAREEQARFTLGRGRGPAHSHIQLSAPTTSRMHAWMELRDGQWQVGRLSQTNDVVVNGSSVALDAPQPLQDGDRLELGEVVFTFQHPLRAEVKNEE